MSATFDTLTRMDAALTKAGHHPLTPFWRRELERLYTHPTARTLVGRIGRGGCKSHSSAKIALNETLFGTWRVPPGERHFFAFVSQNKDEASQRLALLESMLSALGVAYKRDGDTIALAAVPLGFRVFACTIGAVSGFRCIGYAADELAKWTAGSEFANPAVEVITSLDAMCVTHADHVRRALISSPFSTIDYHAERFELGETEEQIVCWAPTWGANPTISEAQTHKLAGYNERLRRREYGALPESALGSAFDADGVIDSFTPRLLTGLTFGSWFCGLDTSKLRGDGICYSIGGFAHPDGKKHYKRKVPPPGSGLSPDLFCGYEIDFETGAKIELPVETKPHLRIVEIGGWEDDEMRATTAEKIVEHIAKRCHAYGIGVVFADDFESVGYSGMFGKHNIRYRPYAWSAPSKHEAISTLNRYFRERTISLVPHEKMRRELLSLQARATLGGQWSYATNGKDFASSLIAIAHALNDGEVLGVTTKPAWTHIHGAPHVSPRTGHHQVSGR